MTQPKGPQSTNQPGRAPRGARPGAMTMAMQAVQVPRPSGPKVLRIGLQRGRTLEERVIRRRETVTVGSSERNHFIVPTKLLPARFELFRLQGNDYVLCFTDQMKGKVGLPSGLFTLEQLRKQGLARRAGDLWQVKLTEQSKGKISIGDATFLFQFVTPPPVMPPPQLPAAVQGGIVRGIDWTFTAFLAFSYILFFGMVIYLENADWPIENQDLDAKVARIMELRFMEEEPPPPEPEEAEEEASEEEAEEEAQAEEAPQPTKSRRASRASSGSSGGPSSGAADSGPTAEEKARLVAEAGAQVESMLIGALGEGGSIEDVLAGGAVTGNSADVLAQAAGVGVATGSGSGTLRARGGGAGSGRTGSLGSLRRTGVAGKRVSTGPVRERRIRGRINLGGGGDIGGSGAFDAAKVAAAIRRRLAGIKRCYESELRNNPGLKGKVVVQFVIQVSGSVTNVKATQNTTGSASVANCVTGIVRRLRFRPGPEGGSVTFEYPFVFAPQG